MKQRHRRAEKHEGKNKAGKIVGINQAPNSKPP